MKHKMQTRPDVVCHASGFAEARAWRPPRLWFICLVSAIFAFSAFNPSASADEIKHGGFTYPGVRIIGLREGQLIYENIGGVEKVVPLEQVESIRMNAYPELANADEAFAASNYAEAAKQLQSIVEKVREDYLKTLVRGRLVVALDRAGRYEEAVRHYLTLVKGQPLNDFVRLAMPRNLPKSPAARDAVRKQLESEIQLQRNEMIKSMIQQMLASLQASPPAAAEAVPPVAAPPPAPGAVAPSQPAPGNAPAPAATPQPAEPVTPTPAPPAPPGARMQLPTAPAASAGDEKDAVAEALAAGNHAQAATLAQQQIDSNTGELSKLLYQRGIAEAAQGKDQDAAVSFMRVVVHFPRSETSLAAMIEAGKVMNKLKQPQHARTLWTEAKELAGSDDAKAAEIQALLDALPK